MTLITILDPGAGDDSHAINTNDSLKEFMMATDMTASGSPEEKLRWAFKMYDEDNSREIDIREMESVMVVSR